MKIKINGKFYDFFNNIAIIFKLDAIASTFSFVGRFDVNNSFHREIFRPLSYNEVEIFNSLGNLIFTGVIVNTSLGSSSNRTLQKISGYSKAGILEDCTIPYALYPLEKIKVSLDDVVSSIVSRYNLNYTVDSSVSNDMSLIYEKTVAQPSETIKSFIAKLAAQRNIILSHDEKGGLVFYRPDTKAKPKFFFTEENTLTMSLDINGQSIFSEISVIRQPSKSNSSLSPVDTIKNELVKYDRTIVKVMSSGEDTDTKKAADNFLAEQLKSISFKLSLNRIINLKCGDIVEVLNPEIYLFNRTRLIVSSYSITHDGNKESMNINLAIPETFTGESPVNIF